MSLLPENLPSTLQLLPRFILVDFARYLLVAGAGWLFFYVIRRKHWLHRKIRQVFPQSADIRRELRLSVFTSGIYGLVGLGAIYAFQHGWTRLYLHIGTHGWPWFFASILLSIFVHDTYFYWTHRLMHHPRLFRLTHRGHHLSTNPSPWAAYAFDPLEAIVQAAIFPVIMVLYPMHPFAFFIFMAWQITFNVLGHAGFEIYPQWFLDSWIGKFLNTPTNHAMHHEYFVGNYGLYFNLWDRWMGTNHKNYEARFREVTTRANAISTAPHGSFPR